VKFDPDRVSIFMKVVGAKKGVKKVEHRVILNSTVTPSEAQGSTVKHMEAQCSTVMHSVAH
jgi:hypothetical protein